jgi:hypothetical protein
MPSAAARTALMRAAGAGAAVRAPKVGSARRAGYRLSLVQRLPTPLALCFGPFSTLPADEVVRELAENPHTTISSLGSGHGGSAGARALTPITPSAARAPGTPQGLRQRASTWGSSLGARLGVSPRGDRASPDAAANKPAGGWPEVELGAAGGGVSEAQAGPAPVRGAAGRRDADPDPELGLAPAAGGAPGGEAGRPAAAPQSRAAPRGTSGAGNGEAHLEADGGPGSGGPGAGGPHARPDAGTGAGPGAESDGERLGEGAGWAGEAPGAGSEAAGPLPNGGAGVPCSPASPSAGGVAGPPLCHGAPQFLCFSVGWSGLGCDPTCIARPCAGRCSPASICNRWKTARQQRRGRAGAGAALRAGLSTPRVSRIDSTVEEEAAAAVAALRIGAEAPIAGKALVEAAFKEIFPASFQTVLPVRNHKARGTARCAAARCAPPSNPVPVISSPVRSRTTPQRGSCKQSRAGRSASRAITAGVCRGVLPAGLVRPRRLRTRAPSFGLQLLGG